MKRSFYILLILLSTILSKAQDLEPRLLALGPVKLNFAVASYAYSNGNIITDAALPVKDLDANVHSIVIGYGRTFRFFGQLGKFDAITSYNFGEWNGNVNQNDTSTIRNGLGDSFFRISIMVIGGPALTPGEFAKHELKKFRLGLEFRLRTPTGQYNPEKLVNIGTNRWGFKFAIGAGYQLKKMLFEARLKGWFFTNNSDFYGGNVLKQQPILIVELDYSYVFKPGLWVAASFDVYYFGKVALNESEYKNPVHNRRIGVTLAIPLAKRHSLKLTYNSGITTRFGANFNTLSIAYQFMWMGK